MNDIMTDQEVEQALSTQAPIVSVPSAPPPALVPLASHSVQQVCSALAVAQGEFKTPKRTKPATVEGTTKDGRRYSYKYMYAPLEEIVDAVKEALAKNGLSRQQYLVARGNQTVLRTIIWHASGEWIASDYPIFPTKEGGQGFASGVTYARRYGLSLALGLAPEDDDDANIADGNIPGTSVANGNGKPADKPATTSAGKLATAPLPPSPPAQHPVDPQTGEISPHRIAIPLNGRGERDWIKWGGFLVAALEAARDSNEVEAWIKATAPDVTQCEKDYPKLHKRVQANIDMARKRFVDPASIEPEFMEASGPQGGARYANVG